MSNHQTGAKNGQWKGGRTISKHGYVLVRVGKDHPLSHITGYAYEHRVVASEKIGRLLTNTEQVHHIDGNKLNNSPDNLRVVSGELEHRFLHRKVDSGRREPGEQNQEIECECGCGVGRNF